MNFNGGSRNNVRIKAYITTEQAEEKVHVATCYVLIRTVPEISLLTDRDIDDYFGLETLKLIVRQPLVAYRQRTTSSMLSANVTGGGVTSVRQAQSVTVLQELSSVQTQTSDPY